MEEFKIFQEERPWGNFRQFTHNENTTVKVISVNANSSLSLQSHNKRKEFLHILAGNPLVTIGEKMVTAKPGDEFVIDKIEKHQIATKDEPAQFLEISYGDFDEKDITRYKDIYGRI